MALVKPDYPTYGPDTFTKLQELVDTFYANDEELKGLIDDIEPSVSVEKAAITLASGYTNNSAYVSAQALKIGPLASFEAGVINCPASFTGNTYYTIGTLPVGYRPTDGKHRLALGGCWTSGGIIPIQFRINETGAIQFVAQANITGATYLIVPSGMEWTID
ncbi:hypothetical protein SEA_THERESITA_22 [Microbacterium phage Theresita]|nr:hypothetical protein SEA_THERESITA_22 [Microbacterium phage Theresita]